MKRNVYIVEDNELVRGTLQEFIEMDPDLQVCGVADTAEAALQRLSSVDADLLLADVSLPGMSGIDLAREVKAQWPDLLCLMLSGHQEPTYARSALAAGARGYVLKGNPVEITDAIRNVLGGETYVSGPLRSKLSE